MRARWQTFVSKEPPITEPKSDSNPVQSSQQGKSKSEPNLSKQTHSLCNANQNPIKRHLPSKAQVLDQSCRMFLLSSNQPIMFPFLHDERIWWVMSPSIPSISNCLTFCQQAKIGERSWIKN